jgi:hypothetical protein
MKKNSTGASTGDRTVLQIDLRGAILLSLALIVASGLLTYGWLRSGKGRDDRQAAPMFADKDLRPGQRPEETPPWGELITYDIRLEQPEEYLAFELDRLRAPTWVFEGMTPAQVRQVMVSAGLTATQVDQALSPALMSIESGNTIVHPDDDLVFGLAPNVRAKLYHELARGLGNQYIRFPFSFTGNSFDQRFSADKVDPAVLTLVRKLVYPRGELECFSDYEVVLRHIPSQAERLRFLEALSSQSAVLARVRIHPETDIDKVLGYWAWPGGVRFKDVRPLLESLTRIPDGGTVSLLYLLPQFARQRLYTFPMPSKAGDPAMDCHWSTMNFFNETPDDRFTDTSYTAKYLEQNYYSIAKPGLYGDLIFFLDANSNTAIHSAVYLADNIVFTKNGNNMAQPWMLMRLKDLTAKYQSDGPARMVVYRNKRW